MYFDVYNSVLFSYIMSNMTLPFQRVLTTRGADHALQENVYIKWTYYEHGNNDNNIKYKKLTKKEIISYFEWLQRQKKTD